MVDHGLFQMPLNQTYRAIKQSSVTHEAFKVNNTFKFGEIMERPPDAEDGEKHLLRYWGHGGLCEGVSWYYNYHSFQNKMCSLWLNIVDPKQ